MKKLLAALAFCLIPALVWASTATLTWDPNTDTNLAGYRVYYANTNVKPFTGTGATEGASGLLVPKGTNTTTLTGLDSTKPYYFAVTAYNPTGQESAYSNIVNVPIFPVKIMSVVSTAARGSITITWPYVQNATSYNMYWSKTPMVGPSNETKITGVTSPYVFSGLPDNTTYYFVITGVNGIAEGIPSAEMANTTLSAPPNPVLNLNCVCTPQ